MEDPNLYLVVLEESIIRLAFLTIVLGNNLYALLPLRLLITFSGAVRKMFRTRVTFGGTMDNYISMERLQVKLNIHVLESPPVKSI